jgi:ribosome recycling factor
MINQLTDNLRKKMDETMQSLKRDMDSISTGRANPSLLDTIRVEIYGSMMPISQLANISIPESNILSIQVWDKESVKSIEKAIINSNLGFNPMTEGSTIRISIPKLSEERRKDLVKLAKKYGEDKKIALRNIRRDALDDFKKNEKELGASKDQVHGFTEIVQKITDEFVAKVDQMVEGKEKDLMKI